MKGINLSEEKNKKHQYAQEQYRNLSEEKTKSINKVVNDIQIFKGQSSIEKIILEGQKQRLVDSFSNDKRLLHKNKNVLNFC